VISRSRSGATSSPDVFETSISSLTKLGDAVGGSQATPLLPAFEENVDSPRSSRTTKRSSRSPARFSSSSSLFQGSQESSRPSSRQMNRVEDVVDHVFRISTPTKSLSNVTTASSRHSTPVPQQAHPQTPPLGGDADRLLSETLAERRGRNGDSQRRRPEYLKRISSQKKNTGVAVVEAEPLDSHPPEGHHPLSLGIAFSPVKGRRIQLVRPSSPSTASQASPRSPHFPPTSSMSNLTLQWLQSSPLTPPNEKPRLVDEAEKESRKRRRLAAFLDDKSPRLSPLKPVEVTGMGRIAVHPDDITEVFVSPVKKFTKKKGSRRAAPVPAPVRKTTIFGLEVREDPLHPLRSSPLPSNRNEVKVEVPEWPETAFPWSSDLHPADDLKVEARKQRLRHLEEFLDRETDEDSDELGGEARGPVHLRVHRSPSTPPQLGNGKSILTEPESSLLVRSISSFSDPGDARTAFFAKHRVRVIASRISREQSPENGNGSEEDDGAINCTCGQDNMGTPMVRCDSCNTWSHQECVGIVDESQLEGEWFCYNCEQRMVPDASREPAFTLTSESPPPRAIPSVKFYEPPPASPLVAPSASRAPDPVPSTPKRASAHNGVSTPFSLAKSATWDLGNVVGSTNLRTPRTPLTQRPMDMRMYSTPKFFSEYDSGGPLQDAFDPTSTPSRGIQFGTPFRDLGSSGSGTPWVNQYGQPPTTPTNRSRNNHAQNDSFDEGRSSSASSIALHLNDTPTRFNDPRSRLDLQSPLSTPYTSSPSLGSFESLDLHSAKREYTSISSIRSDPNDASHGLATLRGKAKDGTSVPPNESAVRTGSGSDEDRY
jgi:PHD-finger